VVEEISDSAHTRCDSANSSSRVFTKTEFPGDLTYDLSITSQLRDSAGISPDFAGNAVSGG